MYVLWAALNGVVLIYLFASCSYAIRAIWQQLGVLPLLLLLFGLYAWHSAAERPAAQRKPTPAPPALTPHAGVITHGYYPIEDHYLNELALRVSYVEQADSAVVLNEQTLLVDFHLGNRWKPRATVVTIRNNQLTYSITGTMSWCLLGLPLYQESKQLQGVIPLP